ncbi:kinesin-like protein KIN-4C [Papaver somniferum]|uniref:kinesin-like protein KIN-4C n=1 Tax=Papaver somniferum TaxID=3469 RepID=UPI000E7040DB|nr:kinesin-like protein KIN-4C [Papaver somniferum]
MESSVKVAVNVRPLNNEEVSKGRTDCVDFILGGPQVKIGTSSFTFDYVYGNKASTSSLSSIYGDCVAPLGDALFDGYNAAVLAYGQTGSGKTYTMGTNYNGDGSTSGIIPQVMNSIFSKIEEKKEAREFLIKVSFIEIYREQVYDLLKPKLSTYKRKRTGPAKAPLRIRESKGVFIIPDVTEPVVSTKQDMASFLSQGSSERFTGSTNMNSESSRSHAIFTISMEQRRSTCIPGDDPGDGILRAKLLLVDLAGSESADTSGTDGLRQKEGSKINRGLLALGKVISELGNKKKSKEGRHVSYNDSNLTRLLKDSLGGNSKTVMIACVSPADTNAKVMRSTLD